MYLLITYKRQAGGTINEEVSVAKRTKPNDIQTCNVIMDYKNRKVENLRLQDKRRKTKENTENIE